MKLSPRRQRSLPGESLRNSILPRHGKNSAAPGIFFQPRFEIEFRCILAKYLRILRIVFAPRAARNHENLTLKKTYSSTMTNSFKPCPSEETHRIIEAFFSSTNANEISETLSLLLDAHIMHGDFERSSLANTVNLVNKLATLAFKLENLQTMKAELQKTKPSLSEIENN